MRNFLAVILAIVAGVTASCGLMSWKVSEMIHDPAPVQEILGSGPAAEDFKAAVPNAIGNLATDATGVVVVDDAINRALAETSRHIMSHPDFDAAWSAALEATRAGWIANIIDLRGVLNAGEELADTSTAAQLQLNFGPITDLVVSMIEDAVAQATAGIPGVENLSIELNPDVESVITTPVPPVSMLTAEQVVLIEELTTMWPAIIALGAIVAVMALVVASRWSRWIVWVVTGVVAALCGAAVKFGYAWLQSSVLDSAQGDISLLRPFLRALQDWSDPQLLVFIAGAVGVALLGILGGFIASNRRP